MKFGFGVFISWSQLKWDFWKNILGMSRLQICPRKNMFGEISAATEDKYMDLTSGEAQGLALLDFSGQIYTPVNGLSRSPIFRLWGDLH